MSIVTTGLVELLGLVNVSQELVRRNKATHKKFLGQATNIMDQDIPVKTGDTLESSGGQENIDGFAVWADTEYAPYNDQGFRHWRSGKRFEGYHYSDHVVDGLNVLYAQEMGKNLTDAIQTLLYRRGIGSPNFLTPFSGFVGSSTFSGVFGAGF